MHRLKSVSRPPTAIVAIMVLIGMLAGCQGEDPVGQRGLPEAKPAATIAGKSVEAFAPGIDDRVAVIGVAQGDSLPVHAFATIDSPAIAQLPPTASDIYGLGQAFETPDGRVWWLIRYENIQGWIQPDAAYLSAPLDITIVASSQLSAPGFATFDDLIDDVTRQFDGRFSGEPIRVSTVEDAEKQQAVAVIDLLKSGDQAVAGTRIVMTGEATSGTWQLLTVDEIQLCTRGVAAGSCA